MNYFIVTTCFFIILSSMGMILFKKGGRRTLVFLFIIFFILSAAFLFLYRNLPFTLFISLGALYITLAMLSLQDIRDCSIIDWQVIFLVGTVVLVRICLVIPLWSNLIAVVLCFLLLFLPYLITHTRGIGIGDLIVFTLVGVLLSPLEAVLIFLTTIVGATIYGSIAAATKNMMEKIPLVPFISLSLFFLLPITGHLIRFMGLENLKHLLSLIGF